MHYNPLYKYFIKSRNPGLRCLPAGKSRPLEINLQNCKGYLKFGFWCLGVLVWEIGKEEREVDLEKTGRKLEGLVEGGDEIMDGRDLDGLESGVGRNGIFREFMVEFM